MLERKTQQIIDKLKKREELASEERAALIDFLENQKRRDDNNGDDILQAFSGASRILMSSSDWEKGIEEIFKIIGESLKLDRVYYFENRLDETSKKRFVTRKAEWNSGADESKNKNPDFIDISLHDVPSLKKVIESGNIYNKIVRNIDQDRLRSFFELQGIKSVLIFPLFVKKNFHGFIGFDDCTTDRVWSKQTIYILQTLVANIAQVMEKNEIQRLLDNTYRQATIGTWEMDIDTDEFIWSSITKEIFELREDETPDRSIAENAFIHEEDRAKVLGAVDETLRSGKPYDMEVEIVTAKGKRKWIRDTGKAEFRDGKPVRIYGTVQDISERKLAQIESEKNKKLLEAIAEQADVSILVRNLKGEHLFVNRKWKETFGLQGKEVIGKTIDELIEKSESEKIIEQDRAVLETNKTIHFEEKVKTADGEKYFIVNKFPIHGIAGMGNAVGSIGADINELKETQEKLRDAEQKLREVVEYSTNLFYSHDTNHRLIYLSPQTKQFFGFEPEEAMRRWTEFATDNPINEIGFKITQKAIATGKPQPPYELELKKGNGDIIWVEVNEAPVVKDGKTILITGSLTDITDRKQGREEIKKSLKEKETLLAEIHHRVKNNLAVVASMMQMQAHVTEDGKLSENLLESVMRIKSMANIHESLYQSKHFADLDFTSNLHSLVTDVINTMQYDIKIETKFNCDKVLLNVNQAIPCSLIINEVVTNILKHAFIGREHGEISVRLSDSGNLVKLSLRDNGIGLPNNFDPELSETLGMQLIKTLTEQLEGNFKYKSGKKGTTFTLEFEKELNTDE